MSGSRMPTWIDSWPDWLATAWFFYVTFHDIVQWAVLALIGYTAWGKRKYKQELETLMLELQHVHSELHSHIHEDASFHEVLGQEGMTKGKPHDVQQPS